MGCRICHEHCVLFQTLSQTSFFCFRLCHKLCQACVCFRFVRKLCVFNRFQLVLDGFTNHVLFSEFVANYVVLAKSQTMCWFSDFVINYSVSDFATNHVLSSEFVTKYVVSAKSQTLWVCVCVVFRF